SLQYMPEHEEEERCGKHRRAYGLGAHFPEAQHLLVEQRGKADHERRITSTKASSRSGCISSISSMRRPALRIDSSARPTASSPWSRSTCVSSPAPPCSKERNPSGSAPSRRSLRNR